MIKFDESWLYYIIIVFVVVVAVVYPNISDTAVARSYKISAGPGGGSGFDCSDYFDVMNCERDVNCMWCGEGCNGLKYYIGYCSSMGDYCLYQCNIGSCNAECEETNDCSVGEFCNPNCVCEAY